MNGLVGNAETSFDYRDGRLRTIRVTIEVRDAKFKIDGLHVAIRYSQGKKHWQTNVEVANLYDEEFNAETLKPNLLKELETFARWLILNGIYEETRDIDSNNDTNIALVPNGVNWTQRNRNFEYEVRNGVFSITRPDLSQPLIAENRRARRIILGELYKRSPQMVEDLTKNKCQFPEDVIRLELAGLRSSDFAHSLDPSGEPDKRFISLSTKGRELYENMSRISTNVIFIIAACENNEREKQGEVIQIYKQAIRDNGFEPKFQEHEEPQKNIHVDIFDYIESCEFVIADITHERADCYVEVGFALALKKPLLLFVEQACLKRMQESKRFPFDLSVVKYQTYSIENLEDLQRKVNERIHVLIGRKATML